MPNIKRSCRRPWMAERKPQEGRKYSNTKFYQSTAWRKLRKVKLEKDPLCEECLKHNIHTPAKVIDHKVPINQGGAALDIANLQSLCDRCHNRKSAKESRKKSVP